MTDTLDIGPTPANEECAQVGEDDYEVRAIAECRRFISLIRKVIGPEPEGARLKIKRNYHDFGTYHEVAVDFDPENTEATEYAFRVESEAPGTWEG